MKYRRYWRFSDSQKLDMILTDQEEILEIVNSQKKAIEDFTKSVEELRELVNKTRRENV